MILGVSPGLVVIGDGLCPRGLTCNGLPSKGSHQRGFILQTPDVCHSSLWVQCFGQGNFRLWPPSFRQKGVTLLSREGQGKLSAITHSFLAVIMVQKMGEILFWTADGPSVEERNCRDVKKWWTEHRSDAKAPKRNSNISWGRKLSRTFLKKCAIPGFFFFILVFSIQ